MLPAAVGADRKSGACHRGRLLTCEVLGMESFARHKTQTEGEGRIVRLGGLSGEEVSSPEPKRVQLLFLARRSSQLDRGS